MCNIYFNYNIYKKNLAYVYSGCFFAAGCGNADAFVETLSSTQCSDAAASFSMSCFSYCGYNMVYSQTSMTVEICVQICNINGFTYSGLAQ